MALTSRSHGSLSHRDLSTVSFEPRTIQGSCTVCRPLSQAGSWWSFPGPNWPFRHFWDKGKGKGSVCALYSLYLLRQAYLNPFNPTTTIEFSMPIKGFVTLTVHDLLGREVITIVDSWQEAGRHQVKWNAAWTFTRESIWSE